MPPHHLVQPAFEVLLDLLGSSPHTLALITLQLPRACSKRKHAADLRRMHTASAAPRTLPYIVCR